MRKNQKKIIGTLLGIMASISGTKAVPKSSIKGDINAGITSSDDKDGKQSEFKKRSEAQTNPYFMAAKFICKALLANELASTTPGLKRVSRTIFRPYFSNYRIVHGFRGYVMKHDNPAYANNVFKLNGDDGHDFRVRVDKGDNFFKSSENEGPCKTVKIESTNIINNLASKKSKFKLSEYLSEPTISLVAEAKVNNENEFYRLFEAKSIWNIDDVANAVGKANKLLDIINDPKINDPKINDPKINDPKIDEEQKKNMIVKQKKNMIVKQFGENIVFVPENNNNEIKLRIFLGKKKFSVIDVEKILKEKFLAGDFGGEVEKGFEDEDNKQYIDPKRKELNETLNTLDKTKDLDCYAEFKLVEVK